MKHIWTVLCRRVDTNKETGQMTLSDIVEDITYIAPSGSAPVDHTGNAIAPANFQIVSLWGRDDPGIAEKGQIRVTLVTPRDPQPGTSPELEADLLNAERFRSVVNITGFLWRGTGEYVFRVEYRRGGAWALAAELPLGVRLQIEPARRTHIPATGSLPEAARASRRPTAKARPVVRGKSKGKKGR